MMMRRRRRRIKMMIDDDWWWLILVWSEGSCTRVFWDTLTCRLSFRITKDLMFLRRAPPQSRSNSFIVHVVNAPMMCAFVRCFYPFLVKTSYYTAWKSCWYLRIYTPAHFNLEKSISNKPFGNHPFQQDEERILVLVAGGVVFHDLSYSTILGPRFKLHSLKLTCPSWKMMLGKWFPFWGWTVKFGSCNWYMGVARSFFQVAFIADVKQIPAKLHPCTFQLLKLMMVAFPQTVW